MHVCAYAYARVMPVLDFFAAIHFIHVLFCGCMHEGGVWSQPFLQGDVCMCLCACEQGASSRWLLRGEACMCLCLFAWIRCMYLSNFGKMWHVCAYVCSSGRRITTISVRVHSCIHTLARSCTCVYVHTGAIHLRIYVCSWLHTHARMQPTLSGLAYLAYVR